MTTDTSKDAGANANSVEQVTDLLSAAEGRKKEQQQNKDKNKNKNGSENDSDENEEHEDEHEEEEEESGASGDDDEQEGSDDEQEEEDDVEGDDEEEEEDDSDSEYSTADIAKLLGVEEDKLDVSKDGKVLIAVKVDGKTSKVGMEDLTRNYQLRKHIDAKATALNSEKKEFDKQSKTKLEELAKSINLTVGLAQMEEKALLDDFNSVDWNKVRAKNAGEYAALQTDYNNRFQDIQRRKQHLVNEMRKHTTEFEKQQAEGLKKYKEEQQTKLVELIPEWNNPTLFNSEKSKMISYYIDNGMYTKEELDNLHDSRGWQALRKAWLYDQGKKTMKTDKKKVVKVPTISKNNKAAPGADKTKIKNLEAKKKAALNGGEQAKLDYVGSLIS